MTILEFGQDNAEAGYGCLAALMPELFAEELIRAMEE